MQNLYVNFGAFSYSPNITIALLQVNGTLVTHSNHIEVVKLIKCKVFCLSSPLRLFINPLTPENWRRDFLPLAGSYVALTVLGRPPGLAQIPLSEAESEMLGVSISSPNSPAAERPYSPQDRFSSTLPSWVWKSHLCCPLCLVFLIFLIMLELFTAAMFCLYSCDGLSCHPSFHIRFISKIFSICLCPVYVMYL